MTRVTGVRAVSAIGLAISIGVMFLVAWAPDNGPTGTSWRQAIALAFVFAAVPIAAWVAPQNPQNLVSVGGGWFAAGAVTMQGGNVLMAVAIPYGLLILLLGGHQQPRLTLRLVGWLLLTTITLIVAVVLAHDTGTLTIGAIAPAAVVASSDFGSFADETGVTCP